MSRPILAGYDPRARVRAPIDFALLLGRHTGAHVIVASVQAGPPIIPLSAGQSLPYAVGRVDEDLVADCAAALEQLEPELRAFDLAVECRKLEGTSAAKALHELAESENACVLVIGASRASAAERALSGSTTQRILHGAPCPVAVVPPAWQADEVRVIGVAYVDSEEGNAALRDAHALARRLGAKLHAITVANVTPAIYAQLDLTPEGRLGRGIEEVQREYRQMAERELRRRVAELGDDVEVEALTGDPAEVLIDVSRRLDLLVCGSRGYGPLRAVLLGSVSRRLVAEARCPVLVEPRGAAGALDAELAGQSAGRAGAQQRAQR